MDTTERYPYTPMTPSALTPIVVGDMFIDRYHIGKVRSLSAEAPIPIVDHLLTKDFPGGAANVVSNFMGLTKHPAVAVFPTNIPIKNRLVTTDNLQLARWDEDDYCEDATPALPPVLDGRVIILSDYGKGAIGEGVKDWALSHLTSQIFIDTKGDPRRYAFFPSSNIILFPNLVEYQRYKEIYDWAPRVVLKQGADGLAWMTHGKVVLSLPSTAKSVVSVNGAGDTVIAAFATAYSHTSNIPTSLQFANTAAAFAVSQPFTSVVTCEDLGASSLEALL